MVEPVEKRIKVNDVSLTYFEWEQAGDETILLVHATGFHARCWDQVVAKLGKKHVIALDMRGHGRSDKTGPYHWKVFGDDLSEFVRQMNLKQIVGVGHSMGGHCMTIAAAKEQQRFSRLVLVDPVIMSPDLYEIKNQVLKWADSSGHPVARRKNIFSDADAMYANFEGRGSYGLWQKEVLRDYCKYGLLPNPEGEGFVLACPPAVEAAIYMGSLANNIYPEIAQITLPVKVLRAKKNSDTPQEMDFSVSPTWEGLAGRFQNGEDFFLPELSHFIPMQAPELVAEMILKD